MYAEKIAEVLIKAPNENEREEFMENINTLTDYVNEVVNGNIKSMNAKLKDGRARIAELEAINADRNSAHDKACFAVYSLQNTMKKYRVAPFLENFELEQEGKVGCGVLYSQKNHNDVANIAAKIVTEIYQMPEAAIDATLDTVVKNIEKDNKKELKALDEKDILSNAERFKKKHPTVDVKTWRASVQEHLDKENIKEETIVEMNMQNGGKLNVVFNDKYSDDFSVTVRCNKGTRFNGREELISTFGPKDRSKLENTNITDIHINYLSEIAEKNGGVLAEKAAPEKTLHESVEEIRMRETLIAAREGSGPFMYGGDTVSSMKDIIKKIQDQGDDMVK